MSKYDLMEQVKSVVTQFAAQYDTSTLLSTVQEICIEAELQKRGTVQLFDLDEQLWDDRRIIDKLGAIQFLVECDSSSNYFDLWSKWSNKSQMRQTFNGHDHEYKRLEWESFSESYPILTIGTVLGRPVCVALNIQEIHGQKVLFIECTSQLADYKMVDDWVKKYCVSVKHKSDAANFHNIAHELQRISRGE